jgi:nucleoside-diphosphate-sugar epimerase
VNILIAGASGNLGSHLTKHLLRGPHRLRLLTHKRAFPFDLPRDANAEIAQADLNDPGSLHSVCKDIDCIVYTAGVLFQPRPQMFLHRTNTIYVRNIVDAALSAGVGKFILVSFPHIEENTTPDAPALGRLDVEPKSIHARTRLEAEKHLFRACENKFMRPVVLRAGVIYGRGVKLTEAARWLMRNRLLAIWREPTWVHLLARCRIFSRSSRLASKETTWLEYIIYATIARSRYRSFSIDWRRIGDTANRGACLLLPFVGRRRFARRRR